MAKYAEFKIFGTGDDGEETISGKRSAFYGTQMQKPAYP
jgi:hypothetical protein